jgi:hypothetical protein
MHNGGSVSAELDKFGRTEMDFFDALPPKARAAIREAKTPIGAKGMYELWSWIAPKEMQLVKAIEDVDKVQVDGMSSLWSLL